MEIQLIPLLQLILFASIACILVFFFSRWHRSKLSVPETALASVVYKLPDMVCEGCAGAITAALKELPGVQEVKPKVARKQVYINYDPSKVKQEQLKSAIGNAGFTPLEA